MKKIITTSTLMLFFCIVQVKAQSTVSPDTVCSSASNKIYTVSRTSGSTYYWVLKNNLGTITTPVSSRTDSIKINYGGIAGIDTLKLVEKGPSGCFGDTVRMAVVVLPVVTATISGTDSICINNNSVGKIKLTFTGTGPWSATFTDGTTPTSLSGIATSTFTINSPFYTLAGIKTYSITTASGAANCSATLSGSGSVTVFGKPSTGAISHY